MTWYLESQQRPSRWLRSDDKWPHYPQKIGSSSLNCMFLQLRGFPVMLQMFMSAYVDPDLCWLITNNDPFFLHSQYHGWPHDIRSHSIGLSQMRKYEYIQSSLRSGPWFNIKMSSYQYRESHCGDKTVVRWSYLQNGISYTGKISLYQPDECTWGMRY